MHNNKFLLVIVVILLAVVGIGGYLAIFWKKPADQKMNTAGTQQESPEEKLERERDARDIRRVADLEPIQLALELYFDAKGTYPKNLDLLSPEFLPVPLKDPLSNETYPYRWCSKMSYHIGADLEDGSSDFLKSDADVTNFCPGDTVNGNDSYSCDGGRVDRYCYDKVQRDTSLQVAPTPPQAVNKTPPAYAPIIIIYPKGGEIMKVGSEQLIRWDPGNVPLDVRFQLKMYEEGNPANVVSVSGLSAGTASFRWVVNAEPNKYYRLRVNMISHDGRIINYRVGDAPFLVTL